MPQTAAYFRNQAQRLREIARTHQTRLSARLIEMASELEKTADELDRQPQRAGAVETSYTINETFTPPAASAITTVPIDLPSRSETGETKIELIRLLGSPHCHH
jgi:hypothetical protein